MLQWQTASEKNNDRFEIEYSDDLSTWVTIGSVQGSGDSKQAINYSFVDDRFTSNINYYRLKQIDFDGQFDYSEIVVAEVSFKWFTSVYPNPNSGQFFISINEILVDFDPSIVIMVNSQGVPVDIETSLDDNVLSIHTLSLGYGVYYVELVGIPDSQAKVVILP